MKTMRCWSKALALMIVLGAYGEATAAPQDTALSERVGMLRGHIEDVQRLAQVAAGARDADGNAGTELERDLVAANQAALAAKEDVRGIRLRLFPYATDDATTALDSLDLSLGRTQDAFMSLRRAARAGEPQTVGLAVDSVTDVSVDLTNAFSSLLRALEKPQIAHAARDASDGEVGSDRRAH